MNCGLKLWIKKSFGRYHIIWVKIIYTWFTKIQQSFVNTLTENFEYIWHTAFTSCGQCVEMCTADHYCLCPKCKGFGNISTSTKTSNKNYFDLVINCFGNCQQYAYRSRGWSRYYCNRDWNRNSSFLETLDRYAILQNNGSNKTYVIECRDPDEIRMMWLSPKTEKITF